MKKFYFICYVKEEEESLLKLLKNFKDKIEDYELSKTFNVQGQHICSCSIVTDEETFSEITKALHGERLF